MLESLQGHYLILAFFSNPGGNILIRVKFNGARILECNIRLVKVNYGIL